MPAITVPTSGGRDRTRGTEIDPLVHPDLPAAHGREHTTLRRALHPGIGTPAAWAAWNRVDKGTRPRRRVKRHSGINLGVPDAPREPTPATGARIERIERINVLSGLFTSTATRPDCTPLPRRPAGQPRSRPNAPLRWRAARSFQTQHVEPAQQGRPLPPGQRLPRRPRGAHPSRPGGQGRAVSAPPRRHDVRPWETPKPRPGHAERGFQWVMVRVRGRDDIVPTHAGISAVLGLSCLAPSGEQDRRPRPGPAAERPSRR
jgi:hypothetical protein